MAKLYEIAAEYNSTFLALLEMDDIDEQTFDDTMSALEGELQEKCKSVAAFFQNIQSDVDAMKQAEKRIADRRKVLEAKANKLRDYLRDNMEFSGITKIECPEFRITLKKPLDVVVVEDIEALPEEYVKVKKEADKTAIKKALKDGAEINGAKLGKGKPGLLIK